MLNSLQGIELVHPKTVVVRGSMMIFYAHASHARDAFLGSGNIALDADAFDIHTTNDALKFE